MKFFKWKKVILFFLITAFLSQFGAGLTAGQTPTPTHWVLKPSERHWWVYNLAATGFPDSLHDELIPALQAYLNLTDDQIEEIKKLRNLYSRRFMTAKGLGQLQTINERSEGRIPRDLEKEKMGEKALEAIEDECILETENARRILGEKFDDFILWSDDQTGIYIEVRERLRKRQKLDGNEIGEKLLENVKKTNDYKSILNREQKKSKEARNRYSSKHEKDLKLRVLYQTTAMSSAWLPARERKEKLRQAKEEMKGILEDIKKNKQD